MFIIKINKNTIWTITKNISYYIKTFIQRLLMFKSSYVYVLLAKPL